MTITRNLAGWAVGQATAEDGERVSVFVGGTALLVTAQSATQLATALLIAAKNVEAVNASPDPSQEVQP